MRISFLPTTSEFIRGYKKKPGERKIKMSKLLFIWWMVFTNKKEINKIKLKTVIKTKISRSILKIR